MSTLTTLDGIKWTIGSHNGRACYHHGDFAICYEANSAWFTLRENGETIFAAKTSHECLSEATEYIWEYLASKMAPCWEGIVFREIENPFTTCPSFFAQLKPFAEA